MTRSQLDRLGERLRQVGTTEEDLRALAEFRNAFISSTNQVARNIESKITNFRADITRRPAKSTPSIIAKLQRESCRLTQIQDIGGVRVVVSKVSVQNRVVDALRGLYQDARVIDRRAKPQHGYRAVHVIVQQDEHYIEVQVRTRIQNGWAQLSEKLADIYDQSIKYGTGPKNIMDNLAYLANYAQNVEQREMMLDEFKRSEINALNRRRRAGRLTRTERSRLKGYNRLLDEKRNAKAAMLRYFKQEIES